MLLLALRCAGRSALGGNVVRRVQGKKKEEEGEDDDEQEEEEEPEEEEEEEEEKPAPAAKPASKRKAAAAQKGKVHSPPLGWVPIVHLSRACAEFFFLVGLSSSAQECAVCCG